MIPKPFIYFDTNIVRVEGVKVPNDKRYLQAMLQVRESAATAADPICPHSRCAPYCRGSRW